MQVTTVTDEGRLRLALPWLVAAVRSEARDGAGTVRLPAAEWLVARAARGSLPATDWRRWLLEGCVLGGDAVTRFPAGPCLHAARRGVFPSGTWACVRPVHLLTGLDHLQLSPAAVSLDDEEAATLAGDINRHLDGTPFRLHTCEGEDWMLECAETVACTCVEPELAAGRNLRELMPSGRDGARVRRLLNELQMLLHEHPVNLRREQRGAATVNSMWLWGFGAAAAPGALSLPPLYTDDPWLEGLWRAHRAASRPLAEFGRDPVAGGTVLFGWSSPPAADAPECLGQSESKCFAPAREALVSGRTRRIDLLAGDLPFTVVRGGRMLFWRRARALVEVLS